MHPTCTHHHEDPTTKKHQTGKRINEESIGGKRKHHLGKETIPAIGLQPTEAGRDRRGRHVMQEGRQEERNRDTCPTFSGHHRRISSSISSTPLKPERMEAIMCKV